MATVDVSRLPRTVALEDAGGVPRLVLLDQTRLPAEEAYLRTSDWRTVIDAIKALVVRGAPAIGIAGAAAVALRAWEFVAASDGGAEALRPDLGAATSRQDATAGEGGASLDCLMCQRSAPDGGCSLGLDVGADGCSQALDAHRTFVLDPEAFDPELFLASLEFAGRLIAGARPTAVNLSWAVERALAEARRLVGEGAGARATAEGLVALTCQMIAEDEAANRAMGAHGAALLPDGATVLTHCNAGSLATAFYGTALGVVYAAAEQGKVRRVFADETRPVGQGARLTAWELARAGVPVTLICDDMAASLLASGQVDAVVVGADRIAANGDVANKVGTLGVAVLAARYGVPFYVAAPLSTVDPAVPDGAAIPIEERDPSEVLPAPIPGVDVWNPAFDVTPAELVTAVITEAGVFAPADVARRCPTRPS